MPLVIELRLSAPHPPVHAAQPLPVVLDSANFSSHLPLDPRKVLLVEDPEGDRKDGGGIGGRDTPLTVRALFLLALLPQGTLAPGQGFFQQSQKQPQSAISLRGPSASWAPPPPQRLSCKSPVSVLLVPEDPPAGGTSLEVQVPGAPLPSCEVLNFKTAFPFIP